MAKGHVLPCNMYASAMRNHTYLSCGYQERPYYAPMNGLFAKEFVRYQRCHSLCNATYTASLQTLVFLSKAILHGYKPSWSVINNLSNCIVLLLR